MKTLTLLLSLISAPAFAAVMPFAIDSRTSEYDIIAVEKIHIQNGAGKVTVIPMVRPKIVILAKKQRVADGCDFTTQKSEFSEIMVKVEQTEKDTCVIDLEVQVPRDIDVYVQTDSGDVTVTGLQGALSFAVASGSVKAEGEFTKVDGTSGSGNVLINGLTGGGSIKTGSGSIDLRFASAPEAGAIEVKTGSGNATLSFPSSAEINANLSTGSGSLLNELKDRQDPDGFGVSVSAGSGNLQLKAL